MKPLKFWVFVISFFTSVTALSAERPLDKVIAVVDKNVVLQSEMEERILQVAERATAQKMTLPDTQVLQQQVIDHLISEQLQLQVAERVGFKVTDEQVNQAIENVRVSNRLSPEAFQRQLAADGISMTELRETLRRDITIQQIQQGMVQQRIYISPLEIENFLQSADAQFWISPEYRLSHILVALPQSPDADILEAAQKKANELVTRIRRGANFAEVAIAESNGPAALQGGDLGWRKAGELGLGLRQHDPSATSSG